MSVSIDHDELADLFLAIGALQPPAELHGYAAGFISVGGRLQRDAWLTHCAEFLDSDTPNPDQADLLYGVYQQALESLELGDVALDLLLPDDEFDLDQRIASLGHWCQGYLTGFAMAGKRQQESAGEREYSADLTEALGDLAAIAQVSADEASEEDIEQDFFAVSEYVRVAAMTIFLECNMDPERPANGERLH
ncbi:MAG: UPF0149 family protein [Spongiibacteraceae bacterium]